MRGHVIHERGKAAGALAQQLPIHIHLRVVVYSLEIHIMPLSLGQPSGRDMQPIPGHAAGQIALARSFVGRHRQLHAPVVWQVDLAPARIIEALLLHVGLLVDIPSSIHAEEAPSFVQFLGVAKRHLGRSLPRHSHQGEQCNQQLFHVFIRFCVCFKLSSHKYNESFPITYTL